MKRSFNSFLLSIAAFSLLACGCASTKQTSGTPAQAQAPTGKEQTGAQLWAQTCMHCHNVRSPSAYSDAQWDTVMLHMRVRATLTAQEHKAILAFLKSAH